MRFGGAAAATVASTLGLIRSEPSPSSATTWRSGRCSAMPSPSGMAALIESHSAKTGHGTVMCGR